MASFRSPLFPKSPPIWRGYRRRLRVTTEGKILLVITLLSGFAAINTGNNLLFFAWGLLLSSIVISGILSEATLRCVQARQETPLELRAGQLSPLPIALENQSDRLPAFGVEVALQLESVRQDSALKQMDSKRSSEVDSSRALCRYQLRLGAGEQKALLAHWVPAARGLYRTKALTAQTAFPFGFFEKTRHFNIEQRADMVVFPRRVEVGNAAAALLSRLGTSPTHRAGLGDEFYSLRPYRQGDDYRSVSWRRSARSARWVVRETEVWSSREVVLILQTAGLSSSMIEYALAGLGSLAEDFLAAHHAVGIVAPGLSVPVGRGGRQRAAILSALALCDATAPLGNGAAGPGVARVGVVVSGQPKVPGTLDSLTLPRGSWSKNVATSTSFAVARGAE